MKKILLLCVFIIIFFTIYFLGSIIKCEILTNKYGDEFTDGYLQVNMITNIDYLKVIDYSDNEAKVYYVSEKESGIIIIFTKNNNLWTVKTWNTIWSKSGSGDGFIWPYIR